MAFKQVCILRVNDGLIRRYRCNILEQVSSKSCTYLETFSDIAEKFFWKKVWEKSLVSDRPLNAMQRSRNIFENLRTSLPTQFAKQMILTGQKSWLFKSWTLGALFSFVHSSLTSREFALKRHSKHQSKSDSVVLTVALKTVRTSSSIDNKTSIGLIFWVLTVSKIESEKVMKRNPFWFKRNKAAKINLYRKGFERRPEIKSKCERSHNYSWVV